MLAHPIVINRLIVVTLLGKKLCRPSEAVLDVLRTPSMPPFAIESGREGGRPRPFVRLKLSPDQRGGVHAEHSPERTREVR